MKRSEVGAFTVLLVRFRPYLALAMLLGACDCGEDQLTGVGADGGPTGGRCVEDTDCPDREACNTSIGVCYPLDECGPDRPCPQAAQACREGQDGFMACVFERCDMDSECANLACPPDKLPACVAGGCICGDPCSGGCPDGQGCCIPEDTCHDLPDLCMGLACPPGQFVSVTSSGAWSSGQCQLLDEDCRCEVLPPLPFGDIGLYSAVAHDGAGAVMTGYNLDYGDLMFGVVQADGRVEWEFVDGVPSSTTSITGDVMGPRGGNSDPGPDVGIYTDIAIGEGGTPHVVYQDRDRGALKYARLGPTGWSVHTVQGAEVGDTGLYSSLAIDPNGRPVVAYLSAREEDGAGGRQSVLRLAMAQTSSPSAASHWRFRDVDTLDLDGFGCEERCNAAEVCLSSNDRCVTPDSPPRCSPSCGQREACVNGACVATRTLPPYRDLPLARGLWPSLGFLPGGTAAVAYYDRFDRNLKIASIAGPDLSSGAIDRRVVDGNGAPNGSTEDAGLFPSLYVTPGGEIHVSYMNATRQALWYKNLDESLTTLATEEIESGLDTGGGPDGELIGADSALVVDLSGVVRVAYQNATLGDLRYARRPAPGAWTVLTLAGDENPYRGSFGFYTDQTLDPSRTAPFVSTYRYFLSAPQGPDNGVEVFNPP